MTHTLDHRPAPIQEPVIELASGASAGPSRARRTAGRLAWATAGAVALGLGYVPASRVPVIADDLQGTFEIYAVSDGNLWNAVRYGVSAGMEGGHFNPIGQAVGAAYHYMTYWVSARLEISPQYVDVLAYLVLIAATITGATALVVWGLARWSHAQPSYWPFFALVCGLTAATLQIHAPWSNDPVVSYGAAGWGSAALGFWTIAWALRATAPSSVGRGPLAITSALAVSCVWYYEMLVAAVAALALVVVATALLAPDRGVVRRRCVVLLGTAVALPAVLFVLGRQLTDVADGRYSGTAVSLGSDAFRTWHVGMTSALPGGGWDYLSSVAGAPVLRLSTVLIAGALAAVVGGIIAAWVRSSARLSAGDDSGSSAEDDRTIVADAEAMDGAMDGAAPATSWRGAPLVVLAAMTSFWVLATATHSVTAKYIQEIQSPGHVYLFYAVGVVAVAALLGLALVLLRPRWRPSVTLGVLPLVGVFIFGQVAVNTSVADAVNRIYPLNASLVSMSTDPDVPVDTRCEVLEAWMLQPWWPGYYSNSVAENLQENYERSFGEPFCPRLEGRRPAGMP
jgi:hypothetical protein